MSTAKQKVTDEHEMESGESPIVTGEDQEPPM
jgi:hypothetical protein